MSLLTDLEDTVGVLLLCRMWEGSDEALWSAGIVVRYGDRSLYVTRGILEFDEHDASHWDICGVGEVACEVERSGSSFRRGDPVLLIFSVGHLTLVYSAACLHLQESFSDWSTNEVSLELGNLCRDLIDGSLALGTYSFILLADSLSLLITHTFLDLGGFWEVLSADLKCHVPIW